MDFLFGGVIGHPIRHSLSPEIFGLLAQGLKRPFAYRRIEVIPSDLRIFLTTSKKSALFQGLNITIPHKEAVVRQLDSCTAEVRVLKAANVIASQDGNLVGHNTDVFGILQTWREKKIQLKGRKVMIFGAGGAALAVGYAAGLRGASEVFIYNRTRARAKKAARRLQREFPKTSFIAQSLAAPKTPSKEKTVAPPVGITLFVNATPIGMHGFAEQSFFETFVFPSAATQAWAFDLVYRPLWTPFLNAAAARGLQTVGGLDMLVWQALEAWKIWFGPIPNSQKWKIKVAKHLVRVMASEGQPS